MEDYLGAFYERVLDTKVLEQAARKVATVHLGAIAIECLLKAMIVERYSIDGWKQNMNGTLHGIVNPGHDLISAIHSIPELRSRIPNSMLGYISLLQTPKLDYIDMRYDCEDIDDEILQKWVEAYKRIRGWLIAQRPFLHPKRRV